MLISVCVKHSVIIASPNGLPDLNADSESADAPLRDRGAVTLAVHALLVAFMPYALAEGIARPAGYLVMLDQPSEFVGTASAFGNFSYGVITALATIAAVAPWSSFTFGLVALTGFTAVAAGALYKASR